MAIDPDSPQELARLSAEWEAQLVVNHLAESGIEARIAGAGTSTGWPETRGDVQVVVRAADLARAQQSLAMVRPKSVATHAPVQFSLKAIFIVMTTAAVLFGLWRLLPGNLDAAEFLVILLNVVFFGALCWGMLLLIQRFVQQRR